MIIEPMIINLLPEFFGDREHILVEHGSLTATTFRYQSGVCALRLENEFRQSGHAPLPGAANLVRRLLWA